MSPQVSGRWKPDIDTRAKIQTLAVPTNRTLAAASDAELAQALCVREPAALEEAFHRHAGQVAKTVRKVTGGHHVEDVVQEVFLSLWRAPERFQPERGSLATYLVTLTRGRAIDALRTDQAWRRRHRDDVLRSRPWNEVEDVVISGVTAAELQIALRVLPMTERVAIELAYFGGYSYRQVAAELGEPEGTIKSRIRVGLHRLEAVLRRTGAVGDD